mgnify:CR=1 FL=1
MESLNSQRKRYESSPHVQLDYTVFSAGCQFPGKVKTFKKHRFSSFALFCPKGPEKQNHDTKDFCANPVHFIPFAFCICFVTFHWGLQNPPSGKKLPQKASNSLFVRIQEKAGPPELLTDQGLNRTKRDPAFAEKYKKARRSLRADRRAPQVQMKRNAGMEPDQKMP